MQDKSNKAASKSTTSRRDLMQKTGMLIGGGIAGASVGQAIAITGNSGKENQESVDYSTIKYNDNEWNLDTFARIMGDLDFGKQKSWKLMGQTPSHLTYDCNQGCYNNTDMMSPKIRAYAKKHHPECFNASTEWVDPSWSSLEHYAHEQTLAQVEK